MAETDQETPSLNPVSSMGCFPAAVNGETRPGRIPDPAGFA